MAAYVALLLWQLLSKAAYIWKGLALLLRERRRRPDLNWPAVHCRFKSRPTANANLEYDRLLRRTFLQRIEDFFQRRRQAG